MSDFANTPKPPYYAVIFSSTLKQNSQEYQYTSLQLEDLAKENEGFLGFEAARNAIGIFVSYWKDLESIQKWKSQTDHRLAQQRGYKEWYKSFRIRIAKVERDYGFDS